MVGNRYLALSRWVVAAVAIALVAAAATITLRPAPAAPQSQAPPEAPDSIEALQAAYVELYQNVAPSVVNVQVVLRQDHPFFPLPEQFQQGLGSGFVWDAQGHIVTNNHVVEGATEVTVTFMNGVTAPAEVVGTDPGSDLAVLRVDPSGLDLRPIRVGDSSAVRVGQLAVTIGNPFGLTGTMTTGIISALGRALPVSAAEDEGQVLQGAYQIPDMLQTDAPINPGNSGGVLVNIDGELIGVPTAIISPSQASAGIGFAVSSALVRRVVPSLIANGRYEHPYLGISQVDLTPPIARAMGLPASQRGSLIVHVTPGGPAEDAGLRGGTGTTSVQGVEVPIGGDVIVAMEEAPVQDADDVISYLARNLSPGDTVTLTILRDGREQTVEVTLGARPQEQAEGTRF